jgi:hypothetical protein
VAVSTEARGTWPRRFGNRPSPRRQLFATNRTPQQFLLDRRQPGLRSSSGRIVAIDPRRRRAIIPPRANKRENLEFRPLVGALALLAVLSARLPQMAQSARYTVNAIQWPQLRCGGLRCAASARRWLVDCASTGWSLPHAAHRLSFNGGRRDTRTRYIDPPLPFPLQRCAVPVAGPRALRSPPPVHNLIFDLGRIHIGTHGGESPCSPSAAPAAPPGCRVSHCRADSTRASSRSTASSPLRTPGPPRRQPGIRTAAPGFFPNLKPPWPH